MGAGKESSSDKKGWLVVIMEGMVGFLVFSSCESVLMGTLLVPPWEGLLMLLVVDWLGGDCCEVSGGLFTCVEEMHVGLLGEAQ